MAAKRKQDSDSAVLRVEPDKLEVLPLVYALLEIEGLLEFLKKFNGWDKDVAK